MELFDRYCISLASMGLRSGLTISGAELQSVTSASAVESIMPPAALRSPAELAGAANPHNAARTRRVSAAGLAPTSGEIVTQIQLGGSRTDSPVRVLYAQPASPFSVGHVQAAKIGATFPRVSEMSASLYGGIL